MDFQDSPLKLTGERTLPGLREENYWFMRHLVVYQKAAVLAEGRSVIDIGCGEGYGPGLIGLTASEVLAVDIAPEVIDHASGKYGRKNLSFRVMDVNDLQVATGSFELAVSFQVIEHLHDIPGYLREMSRVITDDGLALVSTPNRYLISPGSDKPINPFHLREFSPVELEELLLGYFDEVRITGLFHSGWLRLNDRLKAVDFIKYYEMGRWNPRFWTHRFFTPLITTGCFKLSDGRSENCLDIIAFCRNPARRKAAGVEESRVHLSTVEGG